MQVQPRQTQSEKGHKSGRRDFLKKSSLGAVGAVLATSAMSVPCVHATENNTLNVGLVGCGGRGTGALMHVLQTEGPKKIVALADVFQNRIDRVLHDATERFPADTDVPQDRQFTGFDGYRKAIDAVGSGGVILLATPPVFRPRELEYAAEKGVHMFAEKSFAVDSPGVRRALKANEVAKAKNLKIVSGLMQRHRRSVQEAIAQIHSGTIGDVTTCWAYRTSGASGRRIRLENESLLAFQIRNFNAFIWTSGSPAVDWLIHNLDVCCWAKGAYPVSAQGQCARQLRRSQDEFFDQYYVEYTFPDGTRLHAQGRYMQGTWNAFQATVHGTTGCAILGEGISNARLYRGHNPTSGNMAWEYTGPRYRGGFQAAHDTLFDAIRNDKQHNEAEFTAFSTMTGILGRLAAMSGQNITWDDAFNSNRSLANVDELVSFDCPAPSQPDENGNYFFPIPGVTELL